MWCYCSSVAWEEWTETLSVSELAKRGATLTGSSGTRHREIQAEAEAEECDADAPSEMDKEANAAADIQAPSIDAAAAAEDFGAVETDVEGDAQLSDLAVRLTGSILAEIGFSKDRAGLRTFLAVAKAEAHRINPGHEPGHPDLSAKLEEAISGWWHGGIARFEHVPCTIGPSDAKGLVVAFSSLGNGIIRPEFGGTLGAVAADYDHLFVMDPAASWCVCNGGGTCTVHPINSLFKVDWVNAFCSSPILHIISHSQHRD